MTPAALHLHHIFNSHTEPIQVVHHIDHEFGYPNHDEPRWLLLTPQFTEYVIQRESPPYIFEDTWACNHCDAHFEKQVSRKKAISHVTEL